MAFQSIGGQARTALVNWTRMLATPAMDFGLGYAKPNHPSNLLYIYRTWPWNGLGASNQAIFHAIILIF